MVWGYHNYCCFYNSLTNPTSKKVTLLVNDSLVEEANSEGEMAVYDRGRRALVLVSLAVGHCGLQWDYSWVTFPLR